MGTVTVNVDLHDGYGGQSGLFLTTSTFAGDGAFIGPLTLGGTFTSPPTDNVATGTNLQVVLRNIPEDYEWVTTSPQIVNDPGTTVVAGNPTQGVKTITVTIREKNAPHRTASASIGWSWFHTYSCGVSVGGTDPSNFSWEISGSGVGFNVDNSTQPKTITVTTGSSVTYELTVNELPGWKWYTPEPFYWGPAGQPPWVGNPSFSENDTWVTVPDVSQTPTSGQGMHFQITDGTNPPVKSHDPTMVNRGDG